MARAVCPQCRQHFENALLDKNKPRGEGPAQLSGAAMIGRIKASCRQRRADLQRDSPRFRRRRTARPPSNSRMVAAPFLAMVFAIMETAIVFFAGQALETAAADSARLIMTGQAQTQGYDQAAVQGRGLRQDLRPVQLRRRPLRRREELHVVRAASTPRKPIDSNGNLQTSNFGYQPGRARQTSSWCA